MSRPLLARATMLSTTLALPAALLAASVLSAQSPAPTQSVDPVTQLSPSAAQADFDVLRRAVEEAHGGFDRFSTRAELDRRFNKHRARLNRPMSTLAFAGIVAEAIAEIRDGHARLELDSVTSGALAGARVLPLRVQLEGERVIVLFNDSPRDSTIRPGMEIVRINGRTLGDVLDTLLPKVSGDGSIETVEEHASLATLRRYSGSTSNRRTLTRSLRVIAPDLRGNGGGVDEYGALLVSYFAEQPFRYFDHIRVSTIAPSFATWLPRTFDAVRAGTVPAGRGGFHVTPAYHPGVGVQQPATHPFLGNLVVLIDGGSFSTTADVAAHPFKAACGSLRSDEQNDAGGLVRRTVPAVVAPLWLR